MKKLLTWIITILTTVDFQTVKDDIIVIDDKED